MTFDGTLTVLHDFGDGTYGNHPQAGVIQGTDGNLYGTDRTGGTFSSGTVYQLTSAGTLNTLYTFGGDTGHGTLPQAALFQGSDGNFYGTTREGGVNGVGTVFVITSTGKLTTLHSFGGNDGDGARPRGGVIEGADGNFYGTTETGGDDGEGTVFKITPTGTFTRLYSFGNSDTDGAYPYNGVIQGTDGNFYGTTESGGVDGVGTVFQITPAGVLTTLYSFTGENDGDSPYAGLFQGSDGNFYGTTFEGGLYGAGTIFQITSAGALTTLYSFTGYPDGANPEAAPIQGADGNFYGTTNSGGVNFDGTVYSFSVFSPGSLQFATGTYNTSENAGSVTLSVTRTNGGRWGRLSDDHRYSDLAKR